MFRFKFTDVGLTFGQLFTFLLNFFLELLLFILVLLCHFISEVMRKIYDIK